MYKRAIILLSFLAYSLALAHSFVPHHHHEEAQSDHHHHHHHHANDKSHHHHEQDDEGKPLSHVFADATHHPASELVIHTAESRIIQKSSYAVDLFIANIGEIIFRPVRPPDPLTIYQEKHYSSQEDSFSLLRAPPTA